MQLHANENELPKGNTRGIIRKTKRKNIMATTLNASWTAVTTDVNGAPPVNPINKYEVGYYLGADPVAGAQPKILVTAPITSVSILNLPDGEMGVRVRTIDTLGVKSEWTAYVTGDSNNVPPAAPGDLTASFIKD